jgi:hypothetical protein
LRCCSDNGRSRADCQFADSLDDALPDAVETVLSNLVVPKGLRLGETPRDLRHKRMEHGIEASDLQDLSGKIRCGRFNPSIASEICRRAYEIRREALKAPAA